MSNEYISAVVIVLVTILPKFGIQIGSDELTSWIQAGVTVVSGVIIMIKRFQRGDIGILGNRK